MDITLISERVKHIRNFVFRPLAIFGTIYLFCISCANQSNTIESKLCKTKNMWYEYVCNSDSDDYLFSFDGTCYRFYDDTVGVWLWSNDVMYEHYTMDWDCDNTMNIIKLYGVDFDVFKIDNDTIFLYNIFNERTILINWGDSTERYQRYVQFYWKKPQPRIVLPDDIPVESFEHDTSIIYF